MVIDDEEDYKYWYRQLELHVWLQDDKKDSFMEKVEEAVIEYENKC